MSEDQKENKISELKQDLNRAKYYLVYLDEIKNIEEIQKTRNEIKTIVKQIQDLDPLWTPLNPY